ncbi:uncharacterized protein IWZ02DRAFT_456129 [Phyllosticta citriasiana]|uniref:uncharacterized protein n=1 Tax=Phyllosticta citriasiana TaxID=595635 RepID=UPI0030FD7BBB
MPVWAPAVACMRTAVSHSPTQGTRLLLSPCVPFTPLYFAPQLTWVHTLLHRSSPESLGLQSLPCLSPWPGIRSATARAEGTLLLVSPYLFLDASESSRHCSRRQASNRNLQSTQKPSEGGSPTCVHHWSILHVAMRARRSSARLFRWSTSRPTTDCSVPFLLFLVAPSLAAPAVAKEPSSPSRTRIIASIRDARHETCLLLAVQRRLVRQQVVSLLRGQVLTPHSVSSLAFSSHRTRDALAAGFRCGSFQERSGAGRRLASTAWNDMGSGEEGSKSKDWGKQMGPGTRVDRVSILRVVPSARFVARPMCTHG